MTEKLLDKKDLIAHSVFEAIKEIPGITKIYKNLDDDKKSMHNERIVINSSTGTVSLFIYIAIGVTNGAEYIFEEIRRRIMYTLRNQYKIIKVDINIFVEDYIEIGEI